MSKTEQTGVCHLPSAYLVVSWSKPLQLFSLTAVQGVVMPALYTVLRGRLKDGLKAFRGLGSPEATLKALGLGS